MSRFAALTLGKFAEHCTAVIGELQEGDTILLTRHGRWLAFVKPADNFGAVEEYDEGLILTLDDFSQDVSSHIEGLRADDGPSAALLLPQTYQDRPVAIVTPISVEEEGRMLSEAAGRLAAERDEAQEERRRRGEPELLFTSEEMLAILADEEPGPSFRQEVLDEWRKAQVLSRMGRASQPLVTWHEL